MAKHEHLFATISHVIAADDPHILVSCQQPGCIDTERQCVLCNEIGNRRRHRAHLGISDPEVIYAIEGLKMAAYARNLDLDAAMRRSRRVA